MGSSSDGVEANRPLTVHVILPEGPPLHISPSFHTIAHMLARSVIENEQGLSAAGKRPHLCTEATLTSANDGQIK
jgi:hypothetical protein